MPNKQQIVAVLTLWLWIAVVLALAAAEVCFLWYISQHSPHWTERQFLYAGATVFLCGVGYASFRAYRAAGTALCNSEDEDS